MRIALQPAYILHSRPYRDSSAILELFTAEHGRFGVVARGARRQTRRGGRNGLLQPFTPLLVSCSGRGELKTLGAVEPAGGPWQLVGDRMFSGMYLNELLMRMLHRYDPHPTLFAAYGEALGALALPGSPDAVLRGFELGLLQDLGYNLVLDIDGDSGAPVTGGDSYRYLPGVGLVSAAGGYPGADLLQMARGEFTGQARRTAKLLLREALSEHLGDEPLRSRELFRARRTGQ